MDFFTEKQMTNTAPIRPLEVNYANADIHDINSDDGYQFQFPQNWAIHGSTNKLIGVRRLRYWATPIFTQCTFWTLANPIGTFDRTGWTYVNETKLWTPPNTWTYDAKLGFWNPPEDTPEEDVPGYNYDQTVDKFAGKSSVSDYIYMYDYNHSIYDIILEMQNDIDEDTTNAAQVYVTYNPSTLVSTISAKDDEGVALAVKYTFDTDDYAANFLKMFNQKITDETIADVKLAHDTLTFTNVWNREDLFFHASFSDSSRQLIGFTGDKWPNANVCYGGNLTSDDFIIRFTQDTVTKVIPRNGVLLMQFSLIYNYANTLVL